MSVMRAVDVLIEKIKTDYKEDIAVVVMMGSHIYGETHSRSDLDMFYVYNTDRGKKLGLTFIIDGIGFDYWPVSWQRLERIANFEERITSIITEGKVMYYSSEQDLIRFNQLKEKALDLSDRKKFIQKASDQLSKVYHDYWNLQQAQSISEARVYAIEIIYTVTYAIALLNRITIKRGRAKLKQEIINMPLVPKDFESLYDTVFVDQNLEQVKKAYGQLIKNTECLIKKEKEIYFEKISFVDNLTGFYEELINYYNKIYRACEINDPVTALFACAEINIEIGEAFKDTGVSLSSLPDLLGSYDPNHLEGFSKIAKQHQDAFVELLTNNGVILKQFQDYEELKSYLDPL